MKEKNDEQPILLTNQLGYGGVTVLLAQTGKQAC